MKRNSDFSVLIIWCVSILIKVMFYLQQIALQYSTWKGNTLD